MANRTAELSQQHYAYDWPTPSEGEFNDRKEVNLLGVAYATEKDPLLKSEIQLALLQCFHGYLMKYVRMILTGSLSSLHHTSGKEAATFLYTLLPRSPKTTSEKGTNRMALLSVCRTLHLAFKGLNADEVYDVLALCLIRALNKYDPTYTDKVKNLCDAIDTTAKTSSGMEFSIKEISDKLDFDPSTYLRLLASKKFLSSIAGPKKKVVGYRRGEEWPPPKTFFQSGPIGFVYFLPRYFRYYLHDYITQEMGTLESKEGVMQLESTVIISSENSHSGSHKESNGNSTIPSLDGNLLLANGSKVMADLSATTMQVDLSEMTLEWVQGTKDKLFRNMTVSERYILYLMYTRGLRWSEIASIMGTDTVTIKSQYEDILSYLKGRFGATQKS